MKISKLTTAGITPKPNSKAYRLGYQAYKDGVPAYRDDIDYTNWRQPTLKEKVNPGCLYTAHSFISNWLFGWNAACRDYIQSLYPDDPPAIARLKYF